MATTRTQTFAEKFEEALREAKERDPQFGLKTLARQLAKGDPRQTETIRRRLMKYRPPKGGGAAEVAPTEPTRHDIEDALGLERDALAPDPQEQAAALVSMEALFNIEALDRLLTGRVEEILGARVRSAA